MSRKEIEIQMLDLEAMKVDPQSRKFADPMKVTVRNLPPALISVVFDKIKQRDASELITAFHAGLKEVEELKEILHDLPENSNYITEITGQIKTAENSLSRFSANIRRVKEEFGEDIQDLPDEVGTLSYLREIADNILGKAVVLELATGKSIMDFQPIDGFDKFEEVCQAVKEVNKHFLLMYFRRIGR